MRIIFGFVLIVGIALAGFAVHMTRGYLTTYQDELAREKSLRQDVIKTTDIYVVTKSVAYGDPVLADNVELVQWPTKSMPKGVFETEETLFPEGIETPRIALRAMEAFEPLLEIKVTEPGEDAGVASRLGVGMRAFAIRVDVASGVSGFLRPGDRVDVYWSGSLPGRRGKVTKLIETSVPLVAIDQIADGQRQSPTIARTVTVEISPQQVASLAQAQSSGSLSLSLVGRGDTTQVSAVDVDQNTLLGIQEAEPVQAAPQAEVCTIRTRKGAQIIDTPIPCSN
jgi:pilus assembly protein CpaB